jgi:hypothetical protein
LRILRQKIISATSRMIRGICHTSKIHSHFAVQKDATSIHISPQPAFTDSTDGVTITTPD